MFRVIRYDLDAIASYVSIYIVRFLECTLPINLTSPHLTWGSHALWRILLCGQYSIANGNPARPAAASPAGMTIRCFKFETAYSSKFQNDRQNKQAAQLSVLCSNGNTIRTSGQHLE